MAEKDYLEKMLQQLAELLRMIQDNQGKPLGDKVTPQIKIRIAALKEFVAKFSELNHKAFESGGLKEEDLEKLIKVPSPSLSEKEKKLLDFSKKLREEAESIQRDLATHKEAKESIYDKNKTQKTKKDISERKKKFKRLGGDTWLPL
ncbi:MAG TPA: hypothetical protein PLC42_02870 [Parachlamydiaceae bacterium]|nr:hypothetical protein [Parachlamydiaceae bacterium]